MGGRGGGSSIASKAATPSAAPAPVRVSAEATPIKLRDVRVGQILSVKNNNGWEGPRRVTAVSGPVQGTYTLTLEDVGGRFFGAAYRGLMVHQE